jgi:hypothetical protein
MYNYGLIISKYKLHNIEKKFKTLVKKLRKRKIHYNTLKQSLKHITFFNVT